MNKTKKVYETPIMVVHGSVEEITLGGGHGDQDFLVFGASDPDGKCAGKTCEISGS